jgi:hypothetical protein
MTIFKSFRKSFWDTSVPAQHRFYGIRHLQWDPKITQEKAAQAHCEKIERVNDQGANLGQSALKLLVLMNGGAAAIALTFIGTLVPKMGEQGLPKIVAVANTLQWFGWGVGLAGFALTCGYLANQFFLVSLNSFQIIEREPWIVESKRSLMWFSFSLLSHAAGAIVGFISLAFFVSGVFALRAAIVHL